MSKQENGLEVTFTWKSTVSISDFIKLCIYLDANPLQAVFEVEVQGKDDVARI